MAKRMEIRTHSSHDITSEAAYSDCGRYRYWLSRRWNTQGQVVNFVMLNPSIADEFKNDPTVERCERRARQLGFGAFCVTNIFAWRETHPSKLRKARAPIGPENQDVLVSQARSADLIIAAWGVHGAHRAQGPTVAEHLHAAGIRLHHLGLTKDGHPRHPLYVSYSVQPLIWNISAG